MKEGYYGILEPVSGSKLDDDHPLVIMPGAAFDTSRNRIGYGKGFYDYFLHEHPLAKTIALAFELQLVSEIPCQEHDVRPQVLITEEQIYDK